MVCEKPKWDIGTLTQEVLCGAQAALETQGRSVVVLCA